MNDFKPIPGHQEKYGSQKYVIAPVPFWMCDQEDANKKKLEGDKKREKRDQPSVHL